MTFVIEELYLYMHRRSGVETSGWGELPHPLFLGQKQRQLGPKHEIS